MALPIDYDTVQVRGKFTYLDGTPARGVIRFTGKIPAVSASSKTIIMPATISVTLEDDGTFVVNLPATNDPDIQPNGWTYNVLEMLTNGGGRTYEIDVPLSAKAAGIDLSDIAPADARLGDPTAFATLSRFEEYRGQVDMAVASIETNVTASATAAAASAATTSGQTAALSVVGDAVQSTRRNGIAERSQLGAGGWIIKRRNVDEYRLMRDVGDGYVADHQLIRGAFISTPGPVAGPAAEPRSMLLNDIGIGIPMIPVPFSDSAAYTGTNWVTLAGYFSGQFPPVTYGLDLATPTVSTTAGSTTVTITSGALTPTLRYNTRRVVIPGAGAGGADLATSVSAMAANGLSFTIAAAASTAVTGVVATIHPGRRSTNSTGAVASWTSPVGATSVGIVSGMGPNGGFNVVAIDGDQTKATFLPTAQHLVDTGIASPTILVANGGTIDPSARILDCYFLSELFSVWQAFASGLDSTIAHSVTITVTGYKRAASNSTRIIVGGFGYGTATTTATTPTALPFIAIRTGKSAPVHELAIDHKPTSATASVFVGGHNHGYEFETKALSVVVDGAAITLVDDQAVAVASNAVLQRRSDLYHTQNTATPSLKARTSYRVDRTGLVVNTLLEAVAQTTVDSAYFGSFTAPHILSRLQLDKGTTVYDLSDYTTYPEGTYVGTGKSTSAVWWQPGGEAAVALLVPTAKEQTGNWSDGFVFVSVSNFPTTSQSSKWYARRKGTMSPGTKWVGEVTYVVSRFPDGADKYFPVS